MRNEKINLIKNGANNATIKVGSKKMPMLISVVLLFALAVVAVFAGLMPNTDNSNRANVAQASFQSNVNIVGSGFTGYWGQLVCLDTELPALLAGSITSGIPMTARDFADIATAGRTQDYGGIFVDLFPGSPVSSGDAADSFAAALWQVVYFCPTYEIVTLWMAAAYRSLMAGIPANASIDTIYQSLGMRPTMQQDFANAISSHNPSLLDRVVTPSSLPNTFWQNRPEHSVSSNAAMHCSPVPAGDYVWLPSYNEVASGATGDLNARNFFYWNSQANITRGDGGAIGGLWQLSGGDRHDMNRLTQPESGTQITSVILRTATSGANMLGIWGFGSTSAIAATRQQFIRPALHLSLASFRDAPDASIDASWGAQSEARLYDASINIDSNTIVGHAPTGYNASDIRTITFDAGVGGQMRGTNLTITRRVSGAVLDTYYNAMLPISSMPYAALNQGFVERGGVAVRAWFTGTDAPLRQQIVVQVIKRVETTSLDHALNISLRGYYEYSAHVWQPQWQNAIPGDASIDSPERLMIGLSEVFVFNAGANTRISSLRFNATLHGWNQLIGEVRPHVWGVYLTTTAYSESTAVPQIISQTHGVGTGDIAEITSWFGCNQRRSVYARVTVLRQSLDMGQNRLFVGLFPSVLHDNISFFNLNVTYCTCCGIWNNSLNTSMQLFSNIDTPINVHAGVGALISGLSVSAYRGTTRVLDTTDITTIHTNCAAGNAATKQVFAINGVDAFAIRVWRPDTLCCCNLRLGGLQFEVIILQETDIGQDALDIRVMMDNISAFRVSFNTGTHGLACCCCRGCQVYVAGNWINDCGGANGCIPLPTQIPDAAVLYGQAVSTVRPAVNPVHPFATFLHWESSRCCCFGDAAGPFDFDFIMNTTTMSRYCQWCCGWIPPSCCCQFALELTAVWEHQYVIIYFANTGGHAVAPAYARLGESFSFCCCTMGIAFGGLTSNWGATFRHWALTPDGSQISSVAPSGTTTVYAVWRDDAWEIYPNPNSVVVYFHIDHPLVDYIDVNGVQTRAIRGMVYRGDLIIDPYFASNVTLLASLIDAWYLDGDPVSFPFDASLLSATEFHFTARVLCETCTTYPCICCDYCFTYPCVCIPCDCCDAYPCVCVACDNPSCTVSCCTDCELCDNPACDIWNCTVCVLCANPACPDYNCTTCAVCDNPVCDDWNCTVCVLCSNPNCNDWNCTACVLCPNPGCIDYNCTTCALCSNPNCDIWNCTTCVLCDNPACGDYNCATCVLCTHCGTWNCTITYVPCDNPACPDYNCTVCVQCTRCGDWNCTITYVPCDNPACPDYNCTTCVQCTHCGDWNCAIIYVPCDNPACPNYNCTTCVLCSNPNCDIWNCATCVLCPNPGCIDYNCTVCAICDNPACDIWNCTTCTQCTHCGDWNCAVTYVPCGNPACTNYNCTACVQCIHCGDWNCPITYGPCPNPICPNYNCTVCVQCTHCGDWNCSITYIPCDNLACSNYNCTTCVQCTHCGDWNCSITYISCDNPACSNYNCTTCVQCIHCGDWNCAITYVPCDNPACTNYNCTTCVLCSNCGDWNCGITYVPCGNPACPDYNCTTCVQCIHCGDWNCTIVYTPCDWCDGIPCMCVNPPCVYCGNNPCDCGVYAYGCVNCGDNPCSCGDTLFPCIACGFYPCRCDGDSVWPCHRCGRNPCECCLDCCYDYPLYPCGDCGRLPSNCICPCNICGQNPCDLCYDCGLCDCDCQVLCDNCNQYDCVCCDDCGLYDCDCDYDYSPSPTPTPTPTPPVPGPCGYYPCICGDNDSPIPPTPNPCLICESYPCECGSGRSGFAAWLFDDGNWMWLFPVAGVVLLTVILVAIIVPVTKNKRRKAAAQKEADAAKTKEELDDGKAKARKAVNDAFKELESAGSMCDIAWKNRKASNYKGLESKAMSQLDRTDNSICNAEKLVDDYVKIKKQRKETLAAENAKK